MKIQHPQKNHGPAYPSRAGIAALAAACMLGALPRASASEVDPPSLPSAGIKVESFWDIDDKDCALFRKQQASEDALLGAYADRIGALPDAVLRQVQDLVRKYAGERAEIWKGHVSAGKALSPPMRTLGLIAAESKAEYERISSEFYQNQDQRRESYAMLGKYAYTDEDMPKAKLADVANTMLKHVRERKALRKKLTPNAADLSAQSSEVHPSAEPEAHPKTVSVAGSSSMSVTVKECAVRFDCVPEGTLQPVQSIAQDRPHVKGLVVLDIQTGQPMIMERTSLRGGGIEELRVANAVPLSDEEMTQQLQNAYDEARSALYLQQQAEEEALLGAYVRNGSAPVPDDTMQQLRNIVLKYAAEREVLRTKYIDLGQQKDALMRRQNQEWDELQKMQECEVYSDYGKLGAPVYFELDGTSVSDQALQGVKAMILQQIRQRAELKRKHQQEQSGLLQSLSDVRIRI